MAIRRQRRQRRRRRPQQHTAVDLAIPLAPHAEIRNLGEAAQLRPQMAAGLVLGDALQQRQGGGAHDGVRVEE
ncbi:hypothetical protein LOZ03_006544, partial [Ophidiomyces ophidiicola]